LCDFSSTGAGSPVGGRVVACCLVKLGRRLERTFLGMVMALLAFLVERRVLKALKRTR